MKKLFWPIIVLVVIGLIVYADPFTPESRKISRKISRILEEAKRTERPWVFIKNDIDRLEFDRAVAYIKENRPDDAIESLSELIKEIHKPLYNIYDQERPRISADWYFESRYYKTLSEAYDLKGDKEGKDKALKKAAQAKKIADKLKPAEDARKSQSKQRERSALLD